METYAVTNQILIIQKTYNERREKEEYYQTHKREFAKDKIMPKWDPASFAAREFSYFPQDQNNYYAKSLIELDKKPF